MEITILGERVSTVERATEILELSRANGNSEGIARSLYAITQIAPGTPAAEQAAADIDIRWEQSREAARKKTADAVTINEKNTSADELEVKWQKSRADAIERTAAIHAALGTNPRPIAQRRRGRKSHLAAKINSSSEEWQIFWAAIILIAIFFCFVLAIVGKR